MLTPAALTDAENDAILRNLRPWNAPTASQVRNCVLGGAFLVPDGMNTARPGEVGMGLASGFMAAVQEGRLFDLGHVPNHVIRSESSRSAELLMAGHIGHPFSAPYCFFHTWDSDDLEDPEAAAMARASGCTQTGALYLVDASDWHAMSDGRIERGTFMIAEAQTIRVYGHDMLLLADNAMVTPQRGADGRNGYAAAVTRSVFSSMPNGISEGAAAANLVDPVMACLLLLATDGIAVDTIEAPTKLNKHRVKADKPPIPPHYVVRAAGYVTALDNRRHKRPSAPAGHHASPVPHLRRGHQRQLHAMHGGTTIWVRDAVINLKDPDAPLARSFYQRRLDEGHRS